MDNGTLLYSDNFQNAISDGFFDLMLGSSSELNLTYGQFYYLDMYVDGDDINWTSPSGSTVNRIQFQSQNGQISTGMIQVNAVNATIIQNDAVTAAKIAPNSINSSHILDNIITAAKIVNDAITSAKLAPSAVNSSHLNSAGTYYFGKLGIGTTGPSADLEIKSSSSIGAVNVTNGTGSPVLFVNASSQRVGIGTTGPAGSLDISNGKFVLTDDDVTHGVTDVEPTNVFGRLAIENQTTGGLALLGLSDADTYGIDMAGIIGTDNTNNAAVNIAGFRKSGTGVATVQDSNKLLSIRNFGTEKFTILGNGNVGIGTASPGVNIVGGSSYLTIRTPASSGTKNAASLELVGWPNGNDDVGSRIDFITQASGYSNTTARIASSPFTWDASRLTFYTTPNGGSLTERVRIDYNGNVGIGTTGPTYQLQLSTDSAAKPSTNTWTISSDARVKKDVRPFTDGLSVIGKIDPVWYRYNGLGGFVADGKDRIGVIGQDIQKAAPYTVNTYKAKLNPGDANETELLNFNSHALTFVLINSVKELKAENDRLKARLAALEARG